MEFIFNDGGRFKYFKGKTGDCVTRAIAIATGKDYKEIYDTINTLAKSERTGKKKRRISNARTGVFKTTERKLLTSLGWSYKPLVKVGDSKRYHLTDNDIDELGFYSGTYIIQIKRHLTVIKNGVVYDTFDASEFEPMIYGYYYKEG